MAIPPTPDFAAGAFATEGSLDAIGTLFNYMLAPPRCYIFQGTSGAIADSAWSAINLESELYDSQQMHSSTNPTRLTVPEPGVYYIAAQADFEANGSGSRRMQIRKNAGGSVNNGTAIRSTITVNAVTGAGNPTTMLVSLDAQLSAGDYLEMFLQQSSGGALQVLGATNGASTFMSARWVAKTV